MIYTTLNFIVTCVWEDQGFFLFLKSRNGTCMHALAYNMTNTALLESAVSFAFCSDAQESVLVVQC